MAITIVNISGAQRGVEADETALNIESFEVRYFPEFKEKLPNKAGQTRGFAVPDQPSREITVSGEVLGTTGLLAADFETAETLANDVDDFGDGSGDIFLDEATVSQSRDGWRSLSATLSSDPVNAAA